jgi:hypothetical protein
MNKRSNTMFTQFKVIIVNSSSSTLIKFAESLKEAKKIGVKSKKPFGVKANDKLVYMNEKARLANTNFDALDRD